MSRSFSTLTDRSHFRTGVASARVATMAALGRSLVVARMIGLFAVVAIAAIAVHFALFARHF